MSEKTDMYGVTIKAPKNKTFCDLNEELWNKQQIRLIQNGETLVLAFLCNKLDRALDRIDVLEAELKTHQHRQSEREIRWEK